MLAWPLKSGVESFVSALSAGDSSVTAAPDVSTVQVREAGVGSVLAASSVARTSKGCTPSPGPGDGRGAVQAPQLPASRRHSKVEPVSPAPKPKLAVVAVVEPC